MFKVGLGYDVHQLKSGRKLILGGCTIPSQKGCLAHSDGDVLVHAIIDALLGAANMGDIGMHYPDSDPANEGISSIKMLEEIWEKIKDEGYSLVNLDTIIVLQEPKISDYIPQMKVNIAEAMDSQTAKISVKATTTEFLGYEGEGKGLSAQAISLLEAL